MDICRQDSYKQNLFFLNRLLFLNYLRLLSHVKYSMGKSFSFHANPLNLLFLICNPLTKVQLNKLHPQTNLYHFQILFAIYYSKPRLNTQHYPLSIQLRFYQFCYFIYSLLLPPVSWLLKILKD